MATIREERSIEKDIPNLKEIYFSDFNFSDNYLRVEFSGKIGNKSDFTKELIDLFTKYITPRTSDRE